MMTGPRQRILFIAAEANPLAKAGGLADVVGSLPKALTELGVDVRIVLPKYSHIDTKRLGFRRESFILNVPFDGINHRARVFSGVLPETKVPVYLIDHPHYEGVGDIYYQDVTNTAEQQVFQVERFIFLCLASLPLFPLLRWWPEVLHCHDWHTASLPLLLRLSAIRDPRYHSIATLYTIHNLALQGSVPLRRFSALLSLSNDGQHLIKGLAKKSLLNVSSMGIRGADLLNTVSPTYAKEILRPEFGAGLDSLLRSRATDLHGVLNGIDYTEFDPSRDRALVSRYSLKTLQKKDDNRSALQAKLKLDTSSPLFGVVSRLTDQKGIGLIIKATPVLLPKGVRFAILGKGEAALERQLLSLSKRFPRSVATVIGFDPTLAQQIYAGSDCFLMPSRYEPCGLGQMIALRYGSVPIVRATGGLKDTVVEGPTGHGFVFQRFTVQDFLAACHRALTTFAKPKIWRELQRRGMKLDFSWQHSALSYQTLYQQALQHHGSTQ